MSNQNTPSEVDADSEREASYLRDRVDDQIDWHDRKSVVAQRNYKNLKIAEIVLAAAVPVFALMSFAGHEVLAAICGAVIGVLAAFQLLNKYQELWHQYRVTAEQLRRIKILYLTECAPFDGGKRFQHLVEQTEGCLANDNASWLQLMKKDEDSYSKNG